MRKLRIVLMCCGAAFAMGGCKDRGDNQSAQSVRSQNTVQSDGKITYSLERTLEAIVDGDALALKKQIDAGVDVNARREDTRTLLHVAVIHGRTMATLILIKYGADVNSKDDNNKSPLSYAVWKSHRDIAEILVSNGATIQTLSEAAYIGDLDLTKKLVAECNDINEGTGGYGPLHCAASGGSTEVAAFLIANSAKVNAIFTLDKEMPLHRAADQGHSDVARLLLANGADLEAQGIFGTPLHYAASRGDPDVVSLLLENGADPSFKRSGLINETPLHRASQRGWSCIAALLLEKSADVKSTNSIGNTALHEAARNGDVAIVKMLADAGCDINCRNDSGRTPLHYAAGSSITAAARSLIARGADLDAKDKDGNTPAQMAAKAGHEFNARILGTRMNRTDVASESSHSDREIQSYVEALSSLPARIGNFLAEDIHIYPSPSVFGASRSYSGEDVGITVYVYPCPGGDPTALAKAELGKAQAELETGKKKGLFSYGTFGSDTAGIIGESRCVRLLFITCAGFWRAHHGGLSGVRFHHLDRGQRRPLCKNSYHVLWIGSKERFLSHRRFPPGTR